jgi:uncharacterized protein with HEPN domain
MNERDKTRFQDMHAEAQRALRFIQGQTRQDLDQNEMLAYALVRCLEIIGEAASQVTEPTRNHYPHLAWRQMIGMRNRLIHGYGNVNLDILWYTVVDVLPPLIIDLEQILSTD